MASRATLCWIVGLVLVCSPAGATEEAGKSIYSMITGGKVIELAATRQLTWRADGQIRGAAISPNGKQVAYVAWSAGVTFLCLVKADGGKPTVVLKSEEDTPSDASAKDESWEPREPLAWSPSGSSLAFPATRYDLTPDAPGKPTDVPGTREYVLVLASNGAVKAAIPLQGDGSVQGLSFSPDSGMVAALRSTSTDSGSNTDVLVCNTATKSCKTVYSEQRDPRSRLTLLGWTDNGAAVLCAKGVAKLVKIALSGAVEVIDRKPSPTQPGEVPVAADAATVFSPNGRLRARQVKGICIDDLETGKLTTAVSSEKAEFRSWLPNSEMMLYAQEERVYDTSKTRWEALNTLWLAALKPDKCSSMCVALDAQPGPPTWSADFHKMAYIRDLQLFVAELETRDASPSDKATAGLPLTEDEEKDLLQVNAKQIGLALRIYLTDWEDKFPPESELRDKLRVYLPNENVWSKPGGGQDIFSFPTLSPEQEKRGEVSLWSILGDNSRLDDFTNRSQTLVGELDAGYGWKAVIYLDGHVKVISK